jgi:hypothetical protein
VGSQVKNFKVGDEVYGDINDKALDHPKILALWPSTLLRKRSYWLLNPRI